MMDFPHWDEVETPPPLPPQRTKFSLSDEIVAEVEALQEREGSKRLLGGLDLVPPEIEFDEEREIREAFHARDAIPRQVHHPQLGVVLQTCQAAHLR